MPLRPRYSKLLSNFVLPWDLFQGFQKQTCCAYFQTKPPSTLDPRLSSPLQDPWVSGNLYLVKDGGHQHRHKRLNTGMAPTCDWMIKIVKVHKLYLNSLHVSIVNRVYRSGTMKYRCENTDVSNKKWLLT